MPDQFPHGPITLEQHSAIEQLPETFVRGTGYDWHFYWCPGSLDDRGRFIAQSRRIASDLRIMFARLHPSYRRAFAAVRQLVRSKWTVEVWDAEYGTHVSNGRPRVGPHLCVTFQAPGDCLSTGTIAADGSLSGEPLD